MKGGAYCYGAATIINGIATGFGAAFGIGLRTVATVELTDRPKKLDISIIGDEAENPQLAAICVTMVLSKFGLSNKYGAKISTKSGIPISRGLSSSSAAANAIVLATFSALNKEYSDMEVINIGIEASLAAGVTLTGAFDDACATYFGDVVVTDNRTRMILAEYEIEEDYDVLIHVPEIKIRKEDVDTEKLHAIKQILTDAHCLARNGDYLSALRINGSAYCEAMGLDSSIAERAMDAGAATAGISGTGPATVVLVEKKRKRAVMRAMGDKKRIITTSLNKRTARPL